MPRKRVGFYVLAIILFVFAVTCLCLASHNFPIRALGFAAIFEGTYVARIASVHEKSVLHEATGQYIDIDLRMRQGPGRLLWIVSLSLVPLLAGSLFLLYIDKVNGAPRAWPVDLFAGVALVCMFAWTSLAAKIVGRRNT